MRSEIIQVSKVSECHDIATLDAYCDDEIAAGWLECLKEAFDCIDDLEVFGELVTYKGLEIRGNLVVVKVRRNRKMAFISLDSISFLEAPKYTQVWCKAYIKYHNR